MKSLSEEAELLWMYEWYDLYSGPDKDSTCEALKQELHTRLSRWVEEWEDYDFDFSQPLSEIVGYIKQRAEQIINKKAQH